jgi:hypothetical protein
MTVAVINGIPVDEAGLHEFHMQEKKARNEAISSVASLAIVGLMTYLLHRYDLFPAAILVFFPMTVLFHCYMPNSATASQKLAEIAKRHWIPVSQKQSVEYLTSHEALQIPAYRELNPWIYGRCTLSQMQLHAAAVEASVRGHLVLLNFFFDTFISRRHFLCHMLLRTALEEVVKEGHGEVVKFLIDVMRDKSIGIPQESFSMESMYQLSQASRQGRLSFMGCFLSAVRITERIEQQIDRAFLNAVRKGLIEEVRFAMASKRAWSSQLLKTALEDATYYRHSAIIALLEPQNLQLGRD